MGMKQTVKNKLLRREWFTRYWERRLPRPPYEDLFRMAEGLAAQGVRFLYLEPPRRDKVRGLSSFEKHRLDHWIFDFNDIAKEKDRLARIYGPDTDLEDLAQLFDGAVVVQQGPRKGLLDYRSPRVNILGGQRFTPGQPEHCRNHIHIFGACTVRGTGVADEETIAAFLQRQLNAWSPNTYTVYNNGIGMGSGLEDDIVHLSQFHYAAGDVVVLCNYISAEFEGLCAQAGIPFRACSPIFNRPHNHGEWFTDDTFHTTAAGNRAISDCLFRILVDDQYVTPQADVPVTQAAPVEKPRAKTDFPALAESAELRAYLDSLQAHRVPGFADKHIGGIVMNCNPFTLGHRYLIESSAAKVDHLYIFVVEENKSFFDFADRIQLVRQGTADLPNVTVLPSGKFIISSVTFPGYFNKDHLTDATIDTSMDVDLFGLFIAPELNIRIRFVGEEPLDPVTRQYNESMRRRLPLYGVAFSEIARKESGSQVISASRVRRMLEAKDLTGLSALVPDTTLRYLQDRFGAEGQAHG